ncbi:MAG: PIG-L deacetylase family protein [Candidatus Hodarchaeales archaeon]
MIDNSFNRVLILAPHTDDGELGLGGTIAKFIEKGTSIYYHAFSNAAKSLPENLPPDTLERELRSAMDVFKVDQSRVHIHPYEVRTFSYHRQEILEKLVEIRNEINPDLVFLPSTHDLHQDHQVMCQEGIRAFKNTRLLGYELPWNIISFPTQCFVILDESHIEKKIQALACYETQKHRTYLSSDFIRSWAITRGTQLKFKFAEAFEVIRWVIS